MKSLPKSGKEIMIVENEVLENQIPKSSICASIVTYEPEIVSFPMKLEAVTRQVDTVFVVDNGSRETDSIRKTCLLFDNVRFIPLGLNAGLSIGHSKAVSYAEVEGFDYCLLLDQDSIVAPEMVSVLSKYMTQETGIVSPLIVDINKDGIIPKLNEKVEQYRYPITSGSLISISAWRRLMVSMRIFLSNLSIMILIYKCRIRDLESFSYLSITRRWICYHSTFC